jgi:predicted DNA-binding WGR domain protein
MRLLAAIMLCLLLNDPAGSSPVEKKKTECAETKAKIRKIQSKMRRGYTPKQGMKMEDELRYLRERRTRVCR